MLAEFETVGAEGVGKQNLRPGCQIFCMDAAYGSRIAQVQFIEAMIEGGAARVQERTHGPIGQERRGRRLEQRGKTIHRFGFK
jgi:hypothetical protein